MREVFSSPVFGVLLTVSLFYGAGLLYARLGFFWLNPVLVSICGVIFFIRISGIDYSTYLEGGNLISFFLGPSVVALGVPLYLNLEEIRRKKKSILASILVASVVGVVTAALSAAWFGAPPEVVASIVPKSVTAPIAMEISAMIGGIPPLTAALVIATGIIGAVLGPGLLNILRVTSRTARGLALGAASHGIGTARALEEGDLEGASGGLAICLNGIATAVTTPILMKLMVMLQMID